VDRPDIVGDEGADVFPDLSTEQPERVIGVAKPPRRKHGRHERDGP